MNKIRFHRVKYYFNSTLAVLIYMSNQFFVFPSSNCKITVKSQPLPSSNLEKKHPSKKSKLQHTDLLTKISADRIDESVTARPNFVQAVTAHPLPNQAAPKPRFGIRRTDRTGVVDSCAFVTRHRHRIYLFLSLSLAYKLFSRVLHCAREAYVMVLEITPCAASCLTVDC